MLKEVFDINRFEIHHNSNDKKVLELDFIEN